MLDIDFGQPILKHIQRGNVLKEVTELRQTLHLTKADITEMGLLGSIKNPMVMNPGPGYTIIDTGQGSDRTWLSEPVIFDEYKDYKHPIIPFAANGGNITGSDTSGGAKNLKAFQDWYVNHTLKATDEDAYCKIDLHRFNNDEKMLFNVHNRANGETAHTILQSDKNTLLVGDPTFDTTFSSKEFTTDEKTIDAIGYCKSYSYSWKIDTGSGTIPITQSGPEYLLAIAEDANNKNIWNYDYYTVITKSSVGTSYTRYVYLKLSDSCPDDKIILTIPLKKSNANTVQYAFDYSVIEIV